MPLERELLDWTHPFSDVLGDWLWERQDRLPGMLVIVPTAQSGRRLRQGLAERGGALAPRVQTPAFFMRGQGCAPDSVELLAWLEVLEGIRDWSEFSVTFPIPPDGEAPNWSLGLAKSLAQVRLILSASVLTMRSAAKRMEMSVEAARWAELAELEERVEKTLDRWGLKSRNAIIRRKEFSWTDDIKEVVLAGVLDISYAVEGILGRCPLPVRVLVSGEREEDFDDWGRPVRQWSEREIAWPEKGAATSGSVTLTGDARQQAQRALRIVSETGYPSNEVALGSADEEVTRDLVRVFSRAGWVAFNPGRMSLPSLAGWLEAWRLYLRRPSIPEAIDLMAFAESGAQVRGKRAQRVEALSVLRDSYLVGSAEDLDRVKGVVEAELAKATDAGEKSKVCGLERALNKVELSLETMNFLKASRERFLREGFHPGMNNFLSSIDPDDETNVAEWLAETAEVAEDIDRPAGAWLELLLAGLRPLTQRAPDNRVMDVQGWLELFYESGRHLVICGMNDGLVPVRSGSDTWLPESTRSILGLVGEEELAARDAYLLSAMLKAREKNGRVDLLVGKSSNAGDVLKPSRLLLSAKGEELAKRVCLLFKDIKPAEVGFAREIEGEWKWKIRTGEPVQAISVTAFSEYLSCPFRFYLNRVLRMSQPEPERREWNARDFGNIAHVVLENFGKDEEAREYDDSSMIESWGHHELDRLISERYGKDPPIAMRIQKEVMKQRLSWFAKVQAGERADGWRIEEVERSFEMEIGGVKVRGQIDRVERNEQSGRVRVLDYKTSSKAKPVVQAHCKRLSASTFFPEHLNGVEEVLFEMPATKSGKKVEARWINLQVPLYAAGVEGVDEVGYFSLGSSEQNVAISIWPDFSDDTRQSALRCAEWVLSRLVKGIFWPPAKKVDFDNYQELAMGNRLDEVVKKEF